MGSEIEGMMNEERFGFISSTDDGGTLFADVPSEAVTSYCRYGMIKLSDNDNRLSAGQDSSRKRPDPRGVDEDGVGGIDVPVEEDMISLELEPDASEDELLLKPASP